MDDALTRMYAAFNPQKAATPPDFKDAVARLQAQQQQTAATVAPQLDPEPMR